MKKLIFGCAMLALVAGSSLAIGPNGTSTSLTAQNANGNTGACTTASCAVAILQVPQSGSFFAGSDAKQGTVGIQVSGTWSGTITFQYSQDEGATWNNLLVFPLLNGQPFLTSGTTTTTANGNWVASVPGITSVRSVMSTYSSGTAVVVQEQYLASMNFPVHAGNTMTFSGNVGTGTAQALWGVKNTQGVIWSIDAQNIGVNDNYLQIFCTPDSGVNLGTTLPALSIPTNGSSGHDTVRPPLFFPAGLCGSGSGLTLAGTTTATGNTDSGIFVNMTYQ